MTQSSTFERADLGPDVTLKAPFPWFGGKSKVAPEVWAALGDVDNYVEPFAGSLAVLLQRPTAPKVETVNDLDHWIVNFWRALQHAPDEVAHYANNPVNEADLTARHIWLVNTGRERIARLLGDPDFYDAKVAGWWVWGICCWIGGGWCSGEGPWSSEDGQLVHLGSAGRGVKTGEAEILAYLNTLAERLRYVRVCCGDWGRVVTNGALSNGTTVGVFLDPPYDIGLRDEVYNTDAEHGNVSTAVREWCIANQDNPRYRIVLAGYDGEHTLPGWRVVEWVANRSYGRANSETANSANRKLERLWLSPNCLGGDAPQQGALWGA